MKNLLFLLSFVICGITNAQYKKLFDFNGSKGELPHSSLTSDGTFLYGMTRTGGPNGFGVVFKIKPDGTEYDTLMSFRGINGAFPNTSMFYDGTFLIGITGQGGINSWGTIFRIKPDGSSYTKLLDFNSASTGGGWPGSDLISDGTFLYGVTGQGAKYGSGAIFKMKPDGTQFDTLHNFGNTAYDGSWPNGSLFYDGTFLYGTTGQGGTGSIGTIYKLRADGTDYKKIYEFTNLTNSGGYPEGCLISDGTFLYGVAHAGGGGGGGVVYKIKPDGKDFSILANFNGTNGCTPFGSLVTDSTFLYGMTSDGGSGTCNNGKGTIYKLKMDGTGFAKLFDFTGATTGSRPYGSLYYDGISFYGMTEQGGANNKGVIFKYSVINISAEIVSNPICNNQCKGIAKVNVIKGTPPYTYNWNTSPTQTNAIATGLCAGLKYKVTVIDSLGGMAIDSVTIESIPPVSSPNICALTVDSLSQYNILVWDKSQYKGGEVDTFIIYREIFSGSYGRIGKVPFDSLSIFTDTFRTLYFPNTGNPNNGTYRYKIAVHDTCGKNSGLSPYHNTIYITNNNGTFSWNLYSIEGNTNPVSSYILIRDDNNTGNWHAVAAVSGTQQTITDPQYATYQNTAAWRVQTQWGINCTPTLKKYETGLSSLKNLKSSESNIYRINNLGTQEFEKRVKIIIFPNPTLGYLTIQTSLKSKIEIINLQGQLIKSFEIIKPQTTIDVSALSNGIYFIEVKAENGMAVKKFIKQ